uniref:RGS domain-containing protein n=1 Tax=Macrostomum lignano TaxID=282301 RepID=A0A1I8H467_9PLAT
PGGDLLIRTPCSLICKSARCAEFVDLFISFRREAHLIEGRDLKELMNNLDASSSTEELSELTSEDLLMLDRIEIESVPKSIETNENFTSGGVGVGGGGGGGHQSNEDRNDDKDFPGRGRGGSGGSNSHTCCLFWCCCCTCLTTQPGRQDESSRTSGNNTQPPKEPSVRDFDSARSRQQQQQQQQQHSSIIFPIVGCRQVPGKAQIRVNRDRERGLGSREPGQDMSGKRQHMSPQLRHFLSHFSISKDEAKVWGESFEKLMQSPNGRKAFREFLKSEYSEENILFWLACEDLKKEVTPEAVEERARVIYEDYISILSPKEVSLDARVREIINKNMVEPTAHTFDDAQVQIFTLMHRDSYPRFLNSQFYKLLVTDSEGGGNGDGGGSSGGGGSKA